MRNPSYYEIHLDGYEYTTAGDKHEAKKTAATLRRAYPGPGRVKVIKVNLHIKRPNSANTTNPTTIRGWVKARAVKIVRNKRGQAVSVKIKT